MAFKFELEDTKETGVLDTKSVADILCKIAEEIGEGYWEGGTDNIYWKLKSTNQDRR